MTERPQSACGAPCYLQIDKQAGSALWLALAGDHRRVTEVISKAEVVGGQSSVVLSKHPRDGSKTVLALVFFVYRLAWVSGSCTRRSLPAMLFVLGFNGQCCSSRKHRDYNLLRKKVFSHHDCICVLRFLAHWCATNKAQVLIVAATGATRSCG
jgi:hypothetical protein